uniref:Uncharacterized protein At5g41620 n=1 Tax=Anthurium amnicola TaxID=1678845 RepID=A0A1D1YG83_9ARAE
MERQKEVAPFHDDEEGLGGAKLPEPPLGVGAKLRRGLCAAKRGGTCTPVCAWKLEERVEDAGHTSADANRDRARAKGHLCRRVSPRFLAAASAGAGAAVSARKLGACLWEIQDLPRSRMSRVSSRARRHRDERLEGRADISPPGHREQVAASSQVTFPAISLDLKLKSGYSRKTSTELLKVLNRIWSLEDKHTSTVSLVKTLKLELEQAQARIQELSQEKQSTLHEIDSLVNHIMGDKEARKSMEQENIIATVQSLRDELEEERRLRRCSESLRERLVNELSETKSAFSKMMKDLEREKNSHNLLEDLCDEFAKGIREFEPGIRELKQKSEKGPGYGCNTLILQFSEAWLDERLQIKLADSQGDLSEKNRIMDRLQCEVGEFLQLRRLNSLNDDVLVQRDTIEDRCLRRRSLESIQLNGAVSAPRYVEDEDSVSSDMHCFELNVGTDATERHDHKHNGVQYVENLEARRNSNATKKAVGSSEMFKNQCSSSSQMKFEGHTQPCNEVKMKFMDNVPAIHRHIISEDGNDANQIYAILHQKPEEGEIREDVQGIKVKLDGARLSNQMIDNSAIDSELGHFCKSHPEGGNMEDLCEGFFCQHYSHTAGRDDASGTSHSLSSPMHRWSYHHTSPDLQISECSKLPQAMKKNSLKAKLLEARLVGQHAHPKISRDSSVGA